MQIEPYVPPGAQILAFVLAIIWVTLVLLAVLTIIRAGTFSATERFLGIALVLLVPMLGAVLWLCVWTVRRKVDRARKPVAP